jgi:hypothetical protein
MNDGSGHRQSSDAVVMMPFATITAAMISNSGRATLITDTRFCDLDLAS